MDAKKALEKLATLRGDLLITNLHMPRMDEFAFIRKVRQDSRFQNLSIITLTLDSTDSVKEKGKALGISARGAKPYRAETLPELVEKALRRHSGN